MKSRFRSWKGVEVLHLDYANFGSDFPALKAEVLEADGMMTAQRPKSLRVLIDLRETVASGDVVSFFKESAARTDPFIQRHALLGITGIKRFLADKVARLIGRPMRVFDSEELALNWLAEGAAPDPDIPDAHVVGLKPGAARQ